MAGYEKEYLIKNLKSNMDRFIVRTINNLIAEKFDLKSNMDRFIEQANGITYDITTDLKSNMDRFIGCGGKSVVEIDKI